ncbi:MAG TPA: tRNA (adenosine(37)-N6)-threonylcarbamoyltransferase complex ATPase subunit type 1 TsaE [Steroidobacteraceae bacterium]|nr:tRNA (adenosine(37)-N6)-threonylcarbamoyltransferase complex ATPase subunit type 1 TsaE [Steroidobacteraceae bacterium]HXR92896.1 tRNA (adenosine(37)-N6)-threonylcarbamoyltransferase complex ATPase subunit type 1 TsaE [Steroidobacteraceae bacterium]
MRRIASTAEETEAFGAELARTRPAVERLLVMELSGDLGAGKTTLARGFLRECGVRGPVRSPTYTLVETYPVSGMTFVHLDLYRLSGPAELENLGLRDWAGDGYTWLVEWPERAGGRLPAPDLSVRLTAQPRSHLIEATARSQTGTAWLAALGGS